MLELLEGPLLNKSPLNDDEAIAEVDIWQDKQELSIEAVTDYSGYVSFVCPLENLKTKAKLDKVWDRINAVSASSLCSFLYSSSAARIFEQRQSPLSPKNSPKSPKLRGRQSTNSGICKTRLKVASFILVRGIARAMVTAMKRQAEQAGAGRSRVASRDSRSKTRRRSRPTTVQSQV